MFCRVKSVRLWQLILGLSVCVSVGAAFLNFRSFASEQDTAVKKRPAVIIDAGHGGFDPGASSQGIDEKNINLQIALTLRDVLTFQGYDVYMTRETDISTDTEGDGAPSKKKSDMHNRLKLIESHPDAIFLSIHQNAFQSSNKGSQVFYNKKNAEGELLAECIQETIKQNLQTDSHRMHKPSGSEYYLLNQSKNPGVLIECGFISNAEERQKLQDPEYQKQLAFCIYQGMLQYVERSALQK